MKTKPFLILFGASAGLLIAIIVFSILKNKTDILGAKVIVSPIDKEKLIFPESSELEYFYEPQPSFIEKKEKPFKVTYTHNSDSLNERYDYSIEKPKDSFRIITLGDSFTFGANVDTQDNWPEQLEEMLNAKVSCKNIKKFEVINLGVGGYDIKYSVERFKRRGEKYDPDLVLWFLTSLNRITDKLTPLFLEYELQDDVRDKLAEKGIYYTDWGKAEEEIFSQFGEDNVLKYQEVALKEISNYYSGKLVLATFANGKNYNLIGSQKEMINNFVASRNESVYFDGVTNLYEIEGATLPDSHPSKKGHVLIAKDILNYMIKERLIPCEQIPGAMGEQ